MSIVAIHNTWLELLDSQQVPDIRMHPDWDAGHPMVVGHSLAVLQHTIVSFNLIRRVRLKALELIGNQVLGDNDTPALLKLFDALAGSDVDCIRISDCEVDSELWNALIAAGRGKTWAVFPNGYPAPHWLIDFPATIDDYWTKIRNSTSHIKTYRKRSRQFTGTLQSYTAPEHVTGFLDAVASLYPHTWQCARHGLATSLCLSNPRWVEFAAKIGALRAYVLKLDGIPIAYMFNTQWHGQFSGVEIGYDQRHYKIAPGMVMLVRIIEDMFAISTPQTVDLGFGDCDYKRHFSTRSIMTCPVLLIKRTLRPYAIALIDYYRARTRNTICDWSKRIGLYIQLKRLHNRGTTQ